MEEDEGSSKVETAKAERSVWLMKCPVVVAKSWQAHPPSDTNPLAKVVLSLDPLRPPDDPSSLQFAMEMASNEPGSMPKSYSLNMSKDIVPMSVFSETSHDLSGFSKSESHEGALSSSKGTHRILNMVKEKLKKEIITKGKVAVEGKVEHKFDMKPNSDSIEEYGKLCRERTNKSMIKNRQIQVINNDRGAHMRPLPGIIGLIPSASKDKKKMQPVKQSDMKRTRRDRGELEDIMFKLFERQPNWALKQLVQETDQPAQFLKEILNELCVYNKRGANQGTYELKPEYKKSVEDTGAE